MPIFWKVQRHEALGFNIDPVQPTSTLRLPWDKPLRSIRISSTSRALLSGLSARLRLLHHHVFPHELRIAGIQDTVGLMYMRIPDLFTPSNSREISTFLRRLMPFEPTDRLMQWCLKKACAPQIAPPHEGPCVCV